MLLKRQVSRQSLADALRTVQKKLEIVQQALRMLARFGSATDQVLTDTLMSFMLILHLLVVHS